VVNVIPGAVDWLGWLKRRMGDAGGGQEPTRRTIPPGARRVNDGVAAAGQKATGVTRRRETCVLDSLQSATRSATVKRLIWSILLILPLGAFGAEVYRSIDENGLVVYSDRPSSDAEKVEVNTRRPVAPAPSSSEAAEEDNAAATDANSPLGAQIPRESTPEEIAADRARNCNYARQMATTYSTAHRLYRNGPTGERVYLSDAELQQARDKAQSDVATWCD
jgi:hypothetical protein